MAPAPFPGVSTNNLNRITMMSESGGNPNAVSPKGAMGRFQVMPATARDPGFGIAPWKGGQRDLDRIGMEYRAKMQSRYGGNLPKMWGAYNAGPGRIDSLIAEHGNDWLRHAPAETQAYIARNMRAARGN